MIIFNRTLKAGACRRCRGLSIDEVERQKRQKVQVYSPSRHYHPPSPTPGCRLGAAPCKHRACWAHLGRRHLKIHIRLERLSLDCQNLGPSFLRLLTLDLVLRSGDPSIWSLCGAKITFKLHLLEKTRKQSNLWTLAFWQNAKYLKSFNIVLWLKKIISASVSLRIVIVKLSRAVEIEQIDMKIYFVL